MDSVTLKTVYGVYKMTKDQITEDLIRTMCLFGVVNDWSVEKLKDEYTHLGISLELVDMVLNEGIE